MSRRRLAGVALGAALLAGAVVMLRSGVEAPPPPAVGPDGQEIRAFHDPALVEPPARPSEPPAAPGELRTDARTRGALVTWPAAPYGFEVSWGRDDGPLDQHRYVSTTGTTLSGLDPGRYRVEVRTVDDIGQRSEPTRTDLEVADEPPSWQRGFGFLQDFTAGADLDPDAWIVPDETSSCVRRDGDDGPLLLVGQCFAQLQPSSQLVLSEPDADGVRGRVVVVADAPPPSTDPTESGDDPGGRNELMVSAGPSLFYGGEQAVLLRVGARQSYLMTDFDSVDGSATTVVLDQDVHGGPGVLHRWELAFTDDEVRVLRDGTQVGAAAFRPEWQRTAVTVSSIIADGEARSTGSTVGVVGLTGEPPDGRPTEIVTLRAEDGEPASQHRIPVRAFPTADTVRVRTYVSGVGDPNTPEQLPPTPTVVGEFTGGQQTQVAVDQDGYEVLVDLPPGAARTGGELVLRSADGAAFSTYEVRLEVVHERGTTLSRRALQATEPGTPSLASPVLVVRRGEVRLSSGQRLRGQGDVQVEVDASALAATGTAGLAGWVALRVDLDGEPILDYPTSAGGPAVAGRYQFTLKVSELAGTTKKLTVKLVPSLSGVTPWSDDFVLRVRD